MSDRMRITFEVDVESTQRAGVMPDYHRDVVVGRLAGAIRTTSLDYAMVKSHVAHVAAHPEAEGESA